MRAIMLLHGFSTDKRDFNKLKPLLNEIYDTVDFVTFPGHEVNGNIDNFDVEKTFDIVISTYDKLNQNHIEIDVMGYSMGGALATYLQRVRKVSKLVLLAPANKYLNFSVITKEILYVSKLYTKVVASNFFHTSNLVTLRKDLNDYNHNFKTNIKIVKNQLLPRYNIKSIKKFNEITKRCNEGLLEIKPPTLIIWGKLDQLVPYSAIKCNYNLCTNPEKKIIELEGISHLLLRSKDIEGIKFQIIQFLR